jgi:hypothetical protein
MAEQRDAMKDFPRGDEELTPIAPWDQFAEVDSAPVEPIEPETVEYAPIEPSNVVDYTQETGINCNWKPPVQRPKFIPNRKEDEHNGSSRRPY